MEFFRIICYGFYTFKTLLVLIFVVICSLINSNVMTDNDWLKVFKPVQSILYISSEFLFKHIWFSFNYYCGRYWNLFTVTLLISVCSYHLCSIFYCVILGNRKKKTHTKHLNYSHIFVVSKGNTRLITKINNIAFYFVTGLTE
jgi:hypothetical protein